MERNHNTVKPRRFPVLRFAILQPVRTEHARLVRRIHGARGGTVVSPTDSGFLLLRRGRTRLPLF